MSRVTEQKPSRTSAAEGATRANEKTNTATEEGALSLDDVGPRGPGAPSDIVEGRVQAAPLSDVMPRVDAMLDTSSNMVLTGAESSSVVDQLARLSPQDARVALDRFERSGQLERLCGAVKEPARARLLELAGKCELLEKRASKTPHEGRFDPPAPPARFVEKKGRSAPRALVELAKEEYADRATDYRAKYDDYLDRCVDAVKGAKDVAEVRGFGPPLPHDDGPYEGRTSRPSTNAVQLAVMEKIAEANGGRAPGDIRLSVELKGSVLGTGVALSGTVGEGHVDGDVVGHEGLATKSEVGTDEKAGASINEEGVSVDLARGKNMNVDERPGREVEKGLPLSVKGTVDANGNLTAAELGVGKIKGGFKQKDGQLTEVSGGVGPVKGKITEESYEMTIEMKQKLGMVEVGGASVVTGNKETGQYTGAVVLKLEKEGVSVEGKVQIDAQLLSEAHARRSITNDVGFYDAPPEVKQGIPWDKLPADVRETYQLALGWNEAEWNKAVKRNDLAITRQYG